MRRFFFATLATLTVSGSALAWQEWQGQITAAGATLDVVCDDGCTYSCTGAGFVGTELETIQYGAALASQCCADNGTSYQDGGWDITPVATGLVVDRKGNLTPESQKIAVAALDRLVASGVTVLDRVGTTGEDVAGNRACFFENPESSLICCQDPQEPAYYAGQCASCTNADGRCQDVDGRVGTPGTILAMSDYWTDLAAE